MFLFPKGDGMQNQAFHVFDSFNFSRMNQDFF
jgi:hypothetical protein